MRSGIDCKGKEWEEIELRRRMIDITGQRFEKLVALFPVKSQGKSQWLCKCDCGNELVVLSALLTNKNTKSCGCGHREKMKHRWEQYREDNNIIGQVFGNLTAIQFLYVENEQSIYRFKCVCGNYIDLPMVRVKSGNTSSCGCLWDNWNDSYKSDIVGQRFGNLVVQSYAGLNKHGGTMFECLCDCGSTTIVWRDSLVRGHTHSCGCLRSIGEKNIKQILEDSRLKYKSQYVFTDLLSNLGGFLLYDFAILDDSGKVERLIEFDGLQHTKPYDFFGGEERFLKQQENDELKNQYALSHNIPLVRIPYNKRDSMVLEDLLGQKYLIKGGS